MGVPVILARVVRSHRLPALGRILPGPVWISGVLVAALTVLAYRRSFAVAFVLDDLTNIVENAAVHVRSFTWDALRAALAQPRPLASVSFAFNYRIGALDVFGYHAVNLAIHLTNGILVFALARKLLALATGLDEGARSAVAVVAAALFLLHPVQTQAVTYLVQRMTSLGATFGFLATWLYLDGRSRAAGAAGRFVLCGAAMAGAFLCKQNYFVLPFVLVGVEALLFPGLADRLRRHKLVVAVLAMGAVVAIAAAAFLYSGTIASEHRRFGISFAERLLTQARVVWLYVSLLAFPLPGRLRVDYAFPVSKGLLDPPTTALALGALAATVAAAWRWRARAPLVAFAVLWFLGNLVVEAVMPLDPVFEQRLYFPSFGPFLLAATGLQRAVRLRVPTAYAAVPLLVALAVATDRRNAMWNDPVALFGAGVADGTAHPRSVIEYANALYLSGRADEAERVFLEATSLAKIVDPSRGFVVMPRDLANALNGLGLVQRDRGDSAAAENSFREALAADSTTPSARINLGYLLFQLDRLGEAERHLTLVPSGSTWANARILLGLIRVRARDFGTARAYYTEAIRADPGAWAAYWSRARAYMQESRFSEAAGDLEVVARARAREPTAFLELGMCLEQLGRKEDAIRRYQTVLELEPRNPVARDAIARLMKQ
jgi:tetratricopeptide (TPR) repeat protein